MHTKKDLIAVAVIISLLFPFTASSQGSAPTAGATEVLFAQGQPFEHDLVLTAYYSPLPDQCCYVKGNFLADVELNGEGHHGADGTAVYAGMVAAPPSYPFGTRIVLPGIGTVTVHDRGGAIQEWKDAHRIDVWAGYGEEGLARALAFGVKRVHAVIYPPASAQPVESIDLTALDAPPEKLRPYLADSTTLLDIHAKEGDRSASVQFLQDRLRTLGYFDEKPNGSFGPATKAGLRDFYADMAATEPDNSLSERGASLIEAAFRRAAAADPVPAIVDASSSPAAISSAQRTLRFLGFYNGRTNGMYDDTFKKAIIAFQMQQGIVASDSAAGAGRIGPQTKSRIALLWRRKHAEKVAVRLLAMRKIDQLIAKRGDDLHQFLSKGDKGGNVRALQKFLVSKNFLAADGITGSFGERTEQALIAYQKDAGIITDADAAGAGYAGPATLARYRQDIRHLLLKIVREKGWQAI
ncbi:MAG: hypothetical protein HOO67_00520 [Candidatus Peribacteraceae bacterium]|nr:hypothetical protein [Candidatus Peribacteraceae bacterium]